MSTMAASRALFLTCVLIAGALSDARAGETAETAAELLARAREVYLTEGPQSALAIFENALHRFRQDEDPSGEAITLGWIGNCHKRFGDYPKALDHLGQALAMKRQPGARLEEGKTPRGWLA